MLGVVLRTHFLNTMANEQTTSGVSPIYQPFQKTDNTELCEKFIIELRSTLEWSNRGRALLNALDAKDLKMNMYVGSELGPILFMFVSRIDRILIRLAQENNIPRGFPVLWWPGKKIKFFGFRPKFENDKQEEVPLELEVDGVAWFKKWSGYLGQLLTWVCPITGDAYWSTTSKNSGDAGNPESIFVSDCARLFSPYITAKLIYTLDGVGAHICAEMMSKKDQVHGAVVSREDPMITTIGEGCNMNLVHKVVVGGPIGKGYVKYWGFEDTITFCKEYNLPVSSAILAVGQAAKTFVSLIQKHRDEMDDILYEDILTSIREQFPDSIKFLEGNRTHREISGLALEGLVVHYIKDCGDISMEDIVGMIEDGVGSVNKLKFPGYTGRTMGIREAYRMDSKYGFSDFRRHIKNWADRWCQTQSGKDYWVDFYTEVWFRLAMDRDIDNVVGGHIRYSDEVKREWNIPGVSKLRSEVKRKTAILLEKEASNPVGPVTLIVPFGNEEDFKIIADKFSDDTVVWDKSKKVDSSWWIRLVNMPPKKEDDSTGPVFSLVPVAKEAWHQKRIDSGLFSKDWINTIESLDVFMDEVGEVFMARFKSNSIDIEFDNRVKSSIEKTVDMVKAHHKEFVESGSQGLFILTGPQVIGKSWSSKQLEKAGIKVVSADSFMGVEFKCELLMKCHQQCQTQALNYLVDGYSVVVDNTGMKRRDCGIYKEIADSTNAKIVPVLMGGEFWLNVDDVERKRCVDLLEQRSLIRERETGKKIVRRVIENTIDSALKDFKEVMGVSVSKDIDKQIITNWLNTFPKPTYKQGIVDDRGVLVYRDTHLMEKCVESLGLLSSKVDNINVSVDRVRCMIQRGIGEFHITLFTPKETKYLKSIIEDTENITLGEHKTAYALVKSMFSSIGSSPIYLGIGSLSNTVGERVFYEVVSWDLAQEIRSKVGLDKKDFHSTLCWTGANDIHIGSKGVESLLK